jgi:PAS domain S-box-containing protein
MPQSLRVLLVEDNPDDAKMVLRELKRAGFDAIVERVDTEAAFLDGLKGNFDFILSDFTLPEFDGMRALELLNKSGLEVPFIIVSGSIGEDIAVEAIKQGAADYLLKDRLARLGPAVRHALEQGRLRKERQQAQADLRATHTQLRQLLEHSPAVLYALKVVGPKVIPYLATEGITELLGFTVSDALQYEWWLAHVHPDDRNRTVASIAETLTQGTSLTEYRLRHKDGSWRWVADKRRLIRDSANEPLEIAGIWTDITERKRAEEFLQQKSREKVGRHKTRMLRDLAAIFGSGAACFIILTYFDILVAPLNKLVFMFKDNLDDLFITPAIVLVGFLVFSYRRWQEVKRQVGEHVKTEEALRTLHDELDMRVQQRTAELARANDSMRAEVDVRQQAEETLKNERSFISAVLDTVGALVVVLDREARVVRFNRACEQLTGYGFGEVEGENAFDLLLLPEERTSVKSEFGNLCSGQFPSTHENHWVTRDGITRLIAWSNTALLGKDGSVEYVIGTGTDITERKRADEEIQYQLHELQRWHEAMLGREDRIFGLKSEINQLLVRQNSSPRYSEAVPA